MEWKCNWESNYNGPDEECPEWILYNDRGDSIGMLSFEPVRNGNELPEHIKDQWVWYQDQGARLTGEGLREVSKKRNELIKKGYPTN